MPDIDAIAFTRLVGPLLSGEKAEIVFETTLESADQTIRPMEICMQYFGEEQPPILVAMAHDVTERQRIGLDGSRMEPASD